MGEDFDRCKFALKPVHIESLAGLLFICLAPAPPPGFDDMRTAIERYIALPARAAEPAGTGARVFSFTFSQSGHSVSCGADQTILAAAEDAGRPLPFSCREGRCGTCRSRLVSGQVDMKHAGGIRQRQIDMGDILVCCSQPLSDLVIDR